MTLFGAYRGEGGPPIRNSRPVWCRGRTVDSEPFGVSVPSSAPTSQYRQRIPVTFTGDRDELSHTRQPSVSALAKRLPHAEGVKLKIGEGAGFDRKCAGRFMIRLFYCVALLLSCRRNHHIFAVLARPLQISNISNHVSKAPALAAEAYIPAVFLFLLLSMHLHSMAFRMPIGDFFSSFKSTQKATLQSRNARLFLLQPSQMYNPHQTPFHGPAQSPQMHPQMPLPAQQPMNSYGRQVPMSYPSFPTSSHPMPSRTMPRPTMGTRTPSPAPFDESSCQSFLYCREGS